VQLNIDRQDVAFVSRIEIRSLTSQNRAQIIAVPDLCEADCRAAGLWARHSAGTGRLLRPRSSVATGAGCGHAACDTSAADGPGTSRV